MRNLFIVTNKGIVMGRSSFHKELANECGIETTDIQGGGVFDQRTNRDKWILFGESFDFGKFKQDQVENHIEHGNVFWYNSKVELDYSIDMERKETELDKF